MTKIKVACFFLGHGVVRVGAQKRQYLWNA